MGWKGRIPVIVNFLAPRLERISDSGDVGGGTVGFGGACELKKRPTRAEAQLQPFTKTDSPANGH